MWCVRLWKLKGGFCFPFGKGSSCFGGRLQWVICAGKNLRGGCECRAAFGGFVQCNE